MWIRQSKTVQYVINKRKLKNHKIRMSTAMTLISVFFLNAKLLTCSVFLWQMKPRSFRRGCWHHQHKENTVNYIEFRGMATLRGVKTLLSRNFEDEKPSYVCFGDTDNHSYLWYWVVIVTVVITIQLSYSFFFQFLLQWLKFPNMYSTRKTL